jgi:hypothetical protein
MGKVRSRSDRETGLGHVRSGQRNNLKTSGSFKGPLMNDWILVIASVARQSRDWESVTLRLLRHCGPFPASCLPRHLYVHVHRPFPASCLPRHLYVHVHRPCNDEFAAQPGCRPSGRSPGLKPAPPDFATLHPGSPCRSAVHRRDRGQAAAPTGQCLQRSPNAA